jgi:hypothetical protein
MGILAWMVIDLDRRVACDANPSRTGRLLHNLAVGLVRAINGGILAR